MRALGLLLLVATLLLRPPLWAQSLGDEQERSSDGQERSVDRQERNGNGQEHSGDVQESWPDRLALGGDEPQLWQLDTTAGPQVLNDRLHTPLGSVWKLFVYSYLLATDQPEQPLRCEGRQPQQESYCCDPGESINREQALIRSCGLYFAPQRLGLQANAWHHYWQSRQAPGWLSDLTQLNEAQSVSVRSLLHALAVIPEQVQAQTRTTLGAIMLQGRGKGGVGALGMLVRAKTFTLPTTTWGTLGGGAGWSDNGTPLWFSGLGSSPQVIQRLAPRMADILLQQPALTVRNPAVHSTPARSCVRVRYFARYPLARVLDAAGQDAPPGALQGKFTLHFQNGQQLSWQAEPGAFWLEQVTGKNPEIQGRFSEADYVARVIDREGDTHYPQASRALAVAARSYLHQQARHQGDCLQLDDSSRFQRVSPHAPSAAAIAAARTTEDLQLQGIEVQYHSHTAKTNLMSWQQAVADEQAGLDFVQILARAYPAATLQLSQDSGTTDCQPLAEAQSWLQHQAPRWRSRLQDEPGFEALPQPVGICLLRQGRPYADKQARRIFVRPNPSLDGRIALTHEYLHLAFAHHPLGEDEAYIENLARRLVRGEP